MSTPAPTELAGLVLEACEWLPSGAEAGLLRVRGRWTAEPCAAGLPSLWITSGGVPHRFDSLPDTRFARDPAVWRGTYVVPASLISEGPDALSLAWPGGGRVTLAPPDLASPPPVPFAADEAADDGPGGEVIDRAVLADRRARRAEAAERKQARLAAEALRAVEALEQRGAELERRLEAERAARSPMPRPEVRTTVAAEVAARRVARIRAGFAEAARVRGQAREWRVHTRANEALAEAPRLSPRDQLEAEAVARAALDAQLDRERARLTAARRAHEADRARLAGLEADLAAERRRRAAAEAALEAARAEARRESGSLTARIAALDHHAAGLACELELQRRAREQAEAAARVAPPAPERAQRVAADLDAAAAALRERLPVPEAAPRAVAATVPPWRRRPPTSRSGHRLRGALVRLAREDPVTAGRILAALLPAQAIDPRAAPPTTTSRSTRSALRDHRRRRARVGQAARRSRAAAARRSSTSSAGALALAELLAGAPLRLRRFSGPQRVSGRRRRVRPVLSALVNARISLAEAARRGRRLDAELAMAALAARDRSGLDARAHFHGRAARGRGRLVRRRARRRRHRRHPHGPRPGAGCDRDRRP